MTGTLRPYLTYSAACHALLVVLGFALVQSKLAKPEQVYRIDFIGATAGTILNREKEAGSKPAPAPAVQAEPARRPAAQKDPDAFNLGKVHKPLPRPSVLDSYDLNKPVSKAPPAGPAAKAVEAPPGPSGPPGEGSGPTVSADMPNFPYPWYLTAMRSSLWDKWSSRMQGLEGECGIVFTVLRDGAVVDLNIEDSSGDGGFDYAAISAVREAAPFAPLPREFEESFLKVHVKFRSS
ncbi:MAG TPA: hypothetical protein DCM05_07695 [Elusimicrobia bacterium]|nr:hypothetical protein [Elusimicrobiota bacterium]